MQDLYKGGAGFIFNSHMKQVQAGLCATFCHLKHILMRGYKSLSICITNMLLYVLRYDLSICIEIFDEMIK